MTIFLGLSIISFPPIFQSLAGLLIVFAVSRVIKLLNGIQSLGGLPGYRVPFQPMVTPGALLPTTWWNPGRRFVWFWRQSMYAKFKSEHFSVVPFILGVPTIVSSNSDVLRQVLSGDNKTHWKRPEEIIAVLAKWGNNVIASQDGEDWRRHRHATGPAFNNELYQMVWTEVLCTYRQIEIAEEWTAKRTVVVPVVQRLCTKMALLIISKCGFGFSFDWMAPPSGPDGRMSIQEALRIIGDNHILALIAPDWLRRLPFPGFSRIQEACKTFTEFMAREISARKVEVQSESESAEQRSDAFTMLVRANEQAAGKWRLDDQEVIGNVFLLLFSGHETTANTLSATLALLALHEDVQNEILEQIVAVVGYDRDPVYNDYSALTKVLAAFYEALRLYPTAYLLSRDAAADTVLNLPNPLGKDGSTSLTIRKGTSIIIDLVGIQYNERYFQDPETFKPARWYDGSSDSEAFSAFGWGPRVCLGRKFATVEAVAFLTMLLRDWRVEPVFEAAETPEMWREKVLSKPKLGIAMRVGDAPLTLTKRIERKDI